MIITDKIKIKINSKTFQRYKDLGYVFDNKGDIIEIDYKDLPIYSREKIKMKCDYCGDEFFRKFADHYRICNSDNYKMIPKDTCRKCTYQKQKEIYLQKYGVENQFQRDDVKEKIKQTFKEKYGVEYISQSKDIQHKIKQNNLLKYGVESTSQLETVKEKAKQTCRERYGCDYAMQTEEFQHRLEQTSLEKYGVRRPTMNNDIKKKVESTVIKKYGVKNVSSSPDIRIKVAKSKYRNGNQISSKQQNYFHSILGGELNYPFGRYFIDIAFPNDKIAIEYNGGGHNLSVKLGYISQSKFIQNEIYRKKQLYQDGWKIITLISDKNKILSETDTIKIYEYALQTFKNGRHWIEIYIDDNKIVNSQGTIELTQITMND